MTYLLHWFAQPWALFTLTALPVLTLLWTWARWRRARTLRQLGASFFIARLTLIGTGRRRLQAFLVFLGVLLIILGAAGPRWGAAAPATLLSGKDVVVILDLSRSMFAEQPSRLERARRSLRDLADELQRRGGHRVALVGFAAHAKLLFPLTGDYSHFRFVLDALDADDLPAEVRPQPGDKLASGTRIGAALRLAVGAHDPKRPGWRDLILLSDGDDPAQDDEWLAGTLEARRQQIPVHVVAIGDPNGAHAIPAGNDVLRFDGDVVQSRLNEAMLQEIARRTDGLYFPAYLHSLPLGRLLRGYLAEQPALEPAPDTPSELAPLEAESRHAWFLLGAFAFLAASMLIGDGPRREQPAHPTATAPAPVRLSFLLLVMPALISAAPLSDVDDLVRQGNDAFRRQDYEAAIMLYEQAQTHAVDPGLVAFNKGAALFRLERHAEAAAHWQRCLEDGAIPPERKARAAYDLGTTLLHQGGDKSRRLLERAVTAFRQCLDANPDGELRADALHNLELARWLWLKAKANGADEPPDTPDSNDHRPQSRFNGEEPQGRNGLAPGHDNGGDKMGGDDGPFGEQKKLAQGPLLVLPDQEELVPLPPDETRAALDRLAARIAAEARAYRQQAPPARPEVKDW